MRPRPVRTAGLVALALLAGVVVPACGQGTFKLTFEPANDRNGLAWGEGWNDRLEKAPETLKKPHDALTEKAAYFLLDVNGKPAIVGVETDPLRLVVDTDGDGDLAEETLIEHPDPKQAGSVFVGATIKGAGADGADVPIALKCILSDDGVPTNLLTRPAGVYRGEARLGDEKLTLILADTSYNGRPSDRTEPGVSADTIAIDYNSDGEFDLWDEIRPLPVITNVGKAFYNVSVAPDGSTITFTAATPKTGLVNVTAPGAILSVSSEPGAYRVLLHGEPMPLPVGKYDVYTIQIIAWDDEGHQWRMQCLELPEKLRTFEIREGETTLIEIGPPMKAKAVPERDGESIVVNVQVWGAYGERYFPYVRDGDPGGWTGMKILDEQGKELDSGEFEYG